MNNKSCGCNKCMSRTPKCTVMKPVCDECRNNACSNSNDNFNNMMRRSRKVCGGREEYKKSCPCDGRKQAQCGCQTASKKPMSCNCSLREQFEKENNECAPVFASEVDILPLAMAYVPYQEWNCNVSNACQGLNDGTIFPELVKPFLCTPCNQERGNW